MVELQQFTSWNSERRRQFNTFNRRGILNVDYRYVRCTVHVSIRTAFIELRYLDVLSIAYHNFHTCTVLIRYN